MAGESSVISPAATAAATGLSAGASVGGQLLNYGLQKSLLRNQYNEYISAAQKAGATPAAIAQGLTGSGASSSPSVSASPAMPDLASNLLSQSDIASQDIRRDVQNQKDFQEMSWNPRRWRADVAKIWSETGVNKSQMRLNGALFGYYQEMEKDIRMKRPWQIQQMQTGVQKMLAECQKILAERDTLNAQGRYYDAASQNQLSQVGYNLAATENQYAQANFNNQNAHNLWLDSFRLMFDNDMRASGWNPNTDTMENLKRMFVTKPKDFIFYWDTVNQSLGNIDSYCKWRYGEDYKKNLTKAATILGVGYGLNRYKDSVENRAISLLGGMLHNKFVF